MQEYLLWMVSLTTIQDTDKVQWGLWHSRVVRGLRWKTAVFSPLPLLPATAPGHDDRRRARWALFLFGRILYASSLIAFNSLMKVRACLIWKWWGAYGHSRRQGGVWLGVRWKVDDVPASHPSRLIVNTYPVNTPFGCTYKNIFCWPSSHAISPPRLIDKRTPISCLHLSFSA